MTHICKFLVLLVLIFSHAESSEQPVVVVELIGQLGNQLFQIAAGESLARDHGAKLIVPELKIMQKCNTQVNRIYVLDQIDTSNPSLSISYHYQEPFFRYHPIPYQPNMSMYGYFQSEKYFIKYKKEIIELFSPSDAIFADLMSRYSDIILDETTVAIHVRTYSEHDPRHEFFCLNGRDYVKKAMGLFPKNSSFIIFSDNMNWCKKNLRGLAVNMRYIENEPFYNDFYLMSMCKNNIISNSSFSWWAAYLNRNPMKVVVAPKKWFNPQTGIDCSDLIPDEWIVIDK